MSEPVNREKGERTIVFSDHSKGLVGDFPVAVAYTQSYNEPDGNTALVDVVDPIFNDRVTNNLYGRIMTLVEATTDSHKLKAVKDLFGKELSSWTNDVYVDARMIAQGGDSSNNIYTRNTF